MRRFKTQKGTFKRKLEKFGDLSTFDFVDMGVARSHGFEIGAKRELFVVKDIATGMLGAFPTEDRMLESVVGALKEFLGGRKGRLAYSDKAPGPQSSKLRSMHLG